MDLHRELKKQLKIKEEELNCAKGKIKELEENQCVLEKYRMELVLVNELLQKQITSHSKEISAIQGKSQYVLMQKLKISSTTT